MKVASIRTHKILLSENLEEILSSYLPKRIPENSVLAVSSKIAALSEGRAVEAQNTDKDKLIRSEAELFLSPDENAYHITFTIKNNTLTPSAGVDESNGNGYFVLWPKDPFASADRIRNYLRKKYGLRNIGVILTDSRSTPLEWGVTGMAIGHSGLEPLKSYIGQPDVFGRKFIFEKSHIAHSLAAAAVVVMGEGKEQTPLALITDIPFVQFRSTPLSKRELAKLKISLEKDLYAQFLKSAKWRKGDSFRK